MTDADADVDVREFTCTDCGIDVYAINDISTENLCLVCRWIRTVPDLDEATKQRLRHGQSGVQQ